MKLYEVTFKTIKGKPVIMKLRLSKEIAKMKNHPKKVIKKTQ